MTVLAAIAIVSATGVLYYAMCRALTTAVTAFVTDGYPPPRRTVTVVIPYRDGEVLAVLTDPHHPRRN